MWTILLSWMFKPWAMVAIGLVVLYGAWQLDRAHQYRTGLETGEKQIIDKSIEQGKKNEAQSKKAHSAARKPGAFERLRNDPMVCRGC